MLEKLQGAQILAFPRDTHGDFANAEISMEMIVEQSLGGSGDAFQISNLFAKLSEVWCRTLLLESEESLSQLEKIKADVLITDYTVMWKCPYFISLRPRDSHHSVWSFRGTLAC